MKDISESDENLTQPGAVPRPISAELAAEILFPTSPPIERADSVDDDSPLMPPLMDS